jgi:hypothetical protein
LNIGGISIITKVWERAWAVQRPPRFAPKVKNIANKLED